MALNSRGQLDPLRSSELSIATRSDQSSSPRRSFSHGEKCGLDLDLSKGNQDSGPAQGRSTRPPLTEYKPEVWRWHRFRSGKIIVSRRNLTKFPQLINEDAHRPRV